MPSRPITRSAWPPRRRRAVNDERLSLEILKGTADALKEQGGA